MVNFIFCSKAGHGFWPAAGQITTHAKNQLKTMQYKTGNLSNMQTKKTKIYQIITLTLLLCLGCKEHDISPNLEPEFFKLLTVPFKAIEVDRLPVFTWEPANDPDGDALSYALYLDTVDASKLISDNIESPSYTLQERLGPRRTYYWRVEAHDNKGGITSSSVFRFTTRDLYPGKTLAEYAPFAKLAFNSAEYFKGSYYNLGGWTDAGPKSDVLHRSSDGIVWVDITNQTSFSPRLLHASVVFNEKLWVIGGRTNNEIFADVWSTVDGENWVLESEEIAIPGIFNHKVVVFKDQLWLVGGSAQNSLLAHVYKSTNGVDWEIANPNQLFFQVAFGHQVVVHNDELWVIGGLNFNEIWKSSDGEYWVKVEPELNMSASKFFGNHRYIFSLDNRLWLINDQIIAYSDDGEKWNQFNDNLEFMAPPINSDFALHNGAVYFPGAGSNNTGEVWYIE